MVAKQKKIEEATKLSYDKQKADAEKFVADKMSILIQQIVNTNNDVTINDSQKLVKTQQINKQIEQLEIEHQQKIQNIEAESLITSLNQSKQFESEQLEFYDSSIRTTEDKEKKKNEIIEQFTVDRVNTENDIIKNQTDVQIDANNKLLNAIKSNEQTLNDSNSRIFEQQQALVGSLQELYRTLQDSLLQTLDQAAIAEQQSIDSSLQTKIEQLNISNQQEEDVLQNQYDIGLITKEEFEKKKTDIERNYASQSQTAKVQAENKKLEIEKKTGNIKKIIEITNIGIDTAKSIAKIQLTVAELTALAALFPAYIPSVALAQAQVPIAIAIGAIQSATVASKKFASGGIAEDDNVFKKVKFITNNSQVKEIVHYERLQSKYKPGGIITEGTTPTADDVPILVSRGETIINSRSSAIFRPLLSEINSYKGFGLKFAEGGIAGSLINNNNNSNIIIGSNSKKTEELLSELVNKSDENIAVNKRILNTEYKAKVSSTELTEAQRIAQSLVDKGSY